MDINALSKKYEDELYHQEFDDRISVQAALAIMRLAIKEVAANAEDGWREATRLNACLAEAQNVRPYAERIHQLEDELAHVRQSWQKDAAALALALLNIEKLEEENAELRQAVDEALLLSRLDHQRWIDIRKRARGEKVE